MAKDIIVTCPQCGSPDVCADAVAKWSYDAQDWVLAGTFDEKTCQTCEYEGHSFVDTPVADLSEAQRAFVNDGADYVRPEVAA